MCTGLCVDASHVAVAFAHWCCKLLLHIGVARCRCYYCCSCPAVNCLHTWQGQTYSLPPAFPAGLSTSFHFSFVRHFRYNGGNNGGKAPLHPKLFAGDVPLSVLAKPFHHPFATIPIPQPIPCTFPAADDDNDYSRERCNVGTLLQLSFVSK